MPQFQDRFHRDAPSASNRGRTQPGWKLTPRGQMVLFGVFLLLDAILLLVVLTLLFKPW